MQHVLIAGGIYHEFERSAAILAERFAALNLRTQVFAEPESALRALARSGSCRLLTVNALRFSMTQHEKYAPLRDQWAFNLSSAGRETLANYVRQGGSLLGLHTASICFDGWAEWGAILGAQWVWGQSFHPPPGPVQVESVGRKDPLTRGTQPFEVFDEVYHHLQVDPQARPILRARTVPDGEYQPVMWTHRFGKGRVVYDALGHGVESINEPTHREIIDRAAAWLLQSADAEGVGHA